MNIVLLIVSLVTWSVALFYAYVSKRRCAAYETHLKNMSVSWSSVSTTLALFAVREAIRKQLTWSDLDEASLTEHIRLMEQQGLDVAPMRAVLRTERESFSDMVYH